MVAGVGFTMSMFVAGLAFNDPEAFQNARLSVVVGSILSAVVAFLVLRFAANERAAVGEQRSEPLS